MNKKSKKLKKKFKKNLAFCFFSNASLLMDVVILVFLCLSGNLNKILLLSPNINWISLLRVVCGYVDKIINNIKLGFLATMKYQNRKHCNA